MYKYIIVDDEPLIRMGIIKKLEPLSDKIICIGEADNGTRAIDLVNNDKPDFAIIDMEMPVMNGKQLLTFLSENYPEIQLIVVSGYKSFDYIKHAISTNVIDYILKPFTDDQIQETVLQAISRIETSESITAQIKMSVEEKENAYYEHDIQVLQNLLLDYAVTDMEIHSEKLTFIKNSTCFSLILLYCPISMDKLFLEEQIKNLGYSEIVLYFPHPANSALGLFLMTFPAQSDYTPLAFGTHFIKEITVYLETMHHIPFWGISNAFSDLSNLHSAYTQCCDALSRMPVSKQCSAYYCYDSSETPTNENFYWNKTEEFLFRIEAGMTDKVHELLIDLHHSYISDPRLTLSDVKYHYHQLTEECLLILKQYINHPAASNSMQNIIQSIFSIEELNNYYQRFFENLSEMLKPKSVYAIDDTITRIKIYTERNYQKNITVDFLSSLFYLNASYLSHLFRKQTGQKYAQYLNQIRIDKAKNLLVTTDRKLYQIARSVGYDNTKYFFRVFKKWTGMTPEQYRIINRIQE